MRVPPYNKFKEEIFDKISDNEKSILFYWSLFDPSSWEEGTTPKFIPESKRGKRRVFKILKERSRLYKKIIEEDENFDKKFIWSELLTNYLLTAEIEKKSNEVGIKNKIKKPTKNTIFPDLMILKPHKIPIEIKGLVSCSELKNRINDEVIKNINKNKEEKYNFFLLLLVFPFCLQEDFVRIKKIIGGYYVYEDIIKNKTKITCKVLCQCVSENYKKEYSIHRLTERVVGLLNN